MSLSLEMWSKPTKAIFNGILLYSICGLLYPFFDYFESASSLASNMSSFMSNGSLDMGISALDVICWLLLAGIIVGVFLYMQGLSQFGNILEPADSTAIGKVRTGAILLIVAAVVDFIPFLGWVGGILNIIAYILMLIGFSALKGSTTFPEIAKKGANLLFVSMILLLVGAGIGFIPLVGGIFKMILNPVAFILMMVGWMRIKNAITA